MEDNLPTNLRSEILMTLSDNKKDDIFIKINSYENKEHAYLVSSLDCIDPYSNRPQVIIVLPTTELAHQTVSIAKSIIKLNEKYSKIKIRSTVLDLNIPKKIEEQLVISTMGALIFCMFMDKSLDVRKIKLFIFEEIDLLINLKKKEDNIFKIITLLNDYKRQILFISTCSSDDSLDYVKSRNSRKLIVKNLLDKKLYFKNSLNFYTNCECVSDCFKSLVNLLNNNLSFKKIIIFLASKNSCHHVYNSLYNDYDNVIILTSASIYEYRKKVIEHFESNEHSSILLTNYPLTIGLKEFKNIDLIVNYDLSFIYGNPFNEYYHKLSHLRRDKSPGFIVNLINRERNSDAQFETFSRLIDYYDIKMFNLDLLDK